MRLRDFAALLGSAAPAPARELGATSSLRLFSDELHAPLCVHYWQHQTVPPTTHTHTPADHGAPRARNFREDECRSASSTSKYVASYKLQAKKGK